MITRGDATFAYVRADDGKLRELRVPPFTCPVRGCGRALTLERELHQSGSGDVAWLLVDLRHRFFYHPTRAKELVRMR